jgi:hypothetical protein
VWELHTCVSIVVGSHCTGAHLLDLHGIEPEFCVWFIIVLQASDVKVYLGQIEHMTVVMMSLARGRFRRNLSVHVFAMVGTCGNMHAGCLEWWLLIMFPKCLFAGPSSVVPTPLLVQRVILDALGSQQLHVVVMLGWCAGMY